MKRFIRRRPSPALVLSLIALFISMGGVSYGVATGSINGCEIKNNSVTNRDVRNGTIRAQEVKRDGLGGGAIKESTLGTVPFAAGVENAAVVSPAGVIVRGRGTNTGLRTGEGRYTVTFNRDVRGCFYVATVGDEGTAGTGSGTASVASNPVNPNSVDVRTANAANNQVQNSSFHLIVTC